MPSTPTANLRLELQATGENDNTWGTKNNTNLQLLENTVTKRQSIALTGSDATLSTTNFADDQARSLCLVLSGTLIANVNVVVPALSHFYLVENNCTGGFSVTIKTPSGSGVVAAQGVTTALYCNATNVVQFTSAASDAATLGGLTAAEFARLAFYNQFTKGSGHTFVTVPDGATVSADCSLGDRFICVLAGNRTLALVSPGDGQSVEFWAKQDATGGRTLAFPANVVFEGGIPPVLTSVGNALDVLYLTYNQAVDTWVCRTAESASAGTTISTVIASNEFNVRLFERVGSPAGVTTVNVSIPAGTVIASLVPGTPALDLSGFASGSTINLVNNGLIMGAGGDGGEGANMAGDGLGFSGSDGRAGGTAVIGPGSGRTFNVYNASGRIWGGGGGAGGGGATSSNGVDRFGKGGGGGGGAGGGRGARGASRTNGNEFGAPNKAVDGDHGTVGLNGTFGSGGTGTERGDATGGDGGDGGDFGAAGAAGGDGDTGETHRADAGGAGAAGLAINQNGGTATMVSGASSPNVKGAIT